MKKIGVGLLVFWLGFNLVLALGIILGMSIFHINAPALTILFNNNSIASIQPDALRTINGLAILLNSFVAALCALSLVVLWQGQARKQIWTYWALVGCLVFVQVAGFISDSYFLNKNLTLNILSAAILFLGLYLVGKAHSKRA